MSNRSCDILDAGIAALLDGETDLASAAELREHLNACAACREAYAAFQALDDALFAHAEAAPPAPAVDLLPGVLNAVAALRAGTRAVDTRVFPADPALMAYVEGDIDELSRLRVERRIAAAAPLREEAEALRRIHSEMETLGAVSLAGQPGVDLVGGVMASIAAMRNVEGIGTTRLTLQDHLHLQSLMEDDLDGRILSELDRRAGENPIFGRELERMRTLKSDLEAIGAGMAASAPEVDLTGRVMLAVRGSRMHTPRVIPMRDRPAPPEDFAPPARGHRVARLVFLAVAASMLLVLGFTARSLFDRAARDRYEVAIPAPHLQVPNESESGASLAPVPETSTEPRVTADGEHDGETLDPDGELTPGQSKRPSLLDAIEMRRRSLLQGARDMDALSRLASLSPDEARELLLLSEISTEALLGVLQFLPDGEAAQWLEKAIDMNPDDVSLREALAELYLNDPEHSDKALEHLAAWRELDQDNSLPRYMEANLLLAQGDDAGALDILRDTANYSSANPHGQQTARQHEQALIAAGYDPDAARYLAALTAGGDEYDRITGLAQDFIDRGREYEAVGDYHSAREMYETVLRMGAHVGTGAALLNEQLAALDAQQAALDALSQLAGVFFDPQMQATIQSVAVAVTGGLTELAALMAALEAVLGGTDLNAINTLTAQILDLGQRIGVVPR